VSLYNSVKAIIEEKNRESSHTILPFFLYCLSILYGFGVKARFVLYALGLLNRKKIFIPVISVGNLTVGGTGKTPVVAMVVKTLLQKGIRPAILSRGYKGKSAGLINVVSDGKRLLLDSVLVGDEPLMLARMFSTVPVITGSDRFITGNYAITNFDVNALILDDGFQRISLKRDLDILVVDSENPVGNGFLFPRGSLREPITAAGRADIAIFTKCKNDNSTVTFFPSKLPTCHSKTKIVGLCCSHDKEISPFSLISGKEVFIFCGIGSPDSFMISVKETGALIAGYRFFDDHHSYTEKEIKEIGYEAVINGASFLITTEKDFVRLKEDISFPVPLFFLKVEIEIFKGLDLLEKKIEGLFS
jgi:tetraacyldisaccharide 4'-kinase